MIGFPGVRRVRVGADGVEIERDPELLSPNADLEPRAEQLEEGKAPEFERWVRETGSGGEDVNRP